MSGGVCEDGSCGAGDVGAGPLTQDLNLERTTSLSSMSYGGCCAPGMGMVDCVDALTRPSAQVDWCRQVRR
jgi:hypothetical protein